MLGSILYLFNVWSIIDLFYAVWSTHFFTIDVFFCHDHIYPGDFLFKWIISQAISFTGHFPDFFLISKTFPGPGNEFVIFQVFQDVWDRSADKLIFWWFGNEFHASINTDDCFNRDESHDSVLIRYKCKQSKLQYNIDPTFPHTAIMMKIDWYTIWRDDAQPS